MTRCDRVAVIVTTLLIDTTAYTQAIKLARVPNEPSLTLLTSIFPYLLPPELRESEIEWKPFKVPHVWEI
ncbi:aspartate-semialdehyde dehydrogenase (plasmid) [Gloeocapsa sp. PCC 7428]|nr:aspartate-semialdehyde dehydrogenase [Gloeocapsa sp. PCC 7428]